MNLYVIGQQHIDRAWKEGAHLLGAACVRSAGECSPGQLKYRLALGELTLLTIRDDEKPVAWMAVKFIQFPNMRALHVEAIYAPGATAAFDLLADYARAGGASHLQGACGESVARLWKQKFGFEEAYRIMRKPLWAAETTAM